MYVAAGHIDFVEGFLLEGHAHGRHLFVPRQLEVGHGLHVEVELLLEELLQHLPGLQHVLLHVVQVVAVYHHQRRELPAALPDQRLHVGLQPLR